MRNAFLAIVLAAGALPAPAFAQSLTISFAQVGNDVVATSSGSLNLNGLTTSSNGGQFTGVYGGAGFIGVGSGSSNEFMMSTGIFGTGQPVNADFTTGDYFGVYGSSGRLFISTAYTSLAPITSTSTFNNATLSSLGLNPGTYAYTAGANTINVSIPAAAATPEPAAWGLMTLGFGLVGGAMRRRKREKIGAVFTATA